MKNTNVYNLLIEAKVGDNIKATKRFFNTVLETVKSDKDLFEKQFLVVNEDHNIDCSDVKKGFNTVAKQLKEAKALIGEAEKSRAKSNLKKANELIKKAHKKLKEADESKDSNINAFHSVVTIAEGLEKEKAI